MNDFKDGDLVIFKSMHDRKLVGEVIETPPDWFKFVLNENNICVKAHVHSDDLESRIGLWKFLVEVGQLSQKDYEYKINNPETHSYWEINPNHCSKVENENDLSS